MCVHVYWVCGIYCHDWHFYMGARFWTSVITHVQQVLYHLHLLQSMTFQISGLLVTLIDFLFSCLPCGHLLLQAFLLVLLFYPKALIMLDASLSFVSKHFVNKFTVMHIPFKGMSFNFRKFTQFLKIFFIFCCFFSWPLKINGVIVTLLACWDLFCGTTYDF